MPDDARIPDDMRDAIADLRDSIHNAEPVATPPGGSPPGPPEREEGGDPPDDRHLADFERNDTGNAARLIKRFGADLVYVDGMGWVCWDGDSREDGGRFAFELGELEGVRRCQWTQAKMYDEVEALRKEGPPPPSPEEEGETDETIRKMLRRERIKAWEDSLKAAQRHALQSGNAGKITAMLDMAKPDLAKPMQAMDAHPWLLTVENGTLDLSPVEADAGQAADGCSDPPPWSARRRSSRRADLITRRVAASYRPGADCPRFKTFLERIQPSEPVRKYLQRLFGYRLTGRADEHVFVVFFGTGRNGKSTLVDVLRRVYGDYAATVPVGLFLDDGHVRADGPRPSLAKLPGVRVVFMSEPKKGSRLDESMVKETTGGEPIETRRLNRDPFEFRPQFVPIMSTNHKPEVRGLDPGIWGRIHLVGFPVTIPAAERDKRLGETLWTERDGILNWMLDGLKEWHEQGLNPPQEILDAVAEYKADSDPLGEFLDSETVAEAGKRVKTADLYERYEDWCKRNGVEPLKQNGFSRRMKDRGFRTVKVSVLFWSGLDLLQGVDAPEMGL
ncbi:DNA primase family protein [Azospirillum sp.]|uniref:DNA primase family protein n=1 Tax=Azospirillum sp. TaxID=34012 RepID=UPI003D74E170